MEAWEMAGGQVNDTMSNVPIISHWSHHPLGPAQQLAAAN
jgi:hypothetical protein